MVVSAFAEISSEISTEISTVVMVPTRLLMMKLHMNPTAAHTIRNHVSFHDVGLIHSSTIMPAHAKR